MEVTRDEVTVPPGDGKLPSSLPDKQNKGSLSFALWVSTRGLPPFLSPMATPLGPLNTLTPQAEILPWESLSGLCCLLPPEKPALALGLGKELSGAGLVGSSWGGGICLGLGGGVQAV